MAQFNGTWEDKGQNETFGPFMEAIGLWLAILRKIYPEETVRRLDFILICRSETTIGHFRNESFSTSRLVTSNWLLPESAEVCRMRKNRSNSPYVGLGEYTEKYKNATSSTTFAVDGNQVELSCVSSQYPDKPMTYKITFGEEFDGKSPDGSDVKTIWTMVSDCEIQEHQKTNFEDGKNREFKITRNVSGDIMDLTVEAVTSKATMTSKMYRKK